MGAVDVRWTGFKRKPLTVEQRADALFSRIVRTRDGGRCRRCGSVWQVDCAHIIRRRFHAVRWVLLNAVSLCRECHDHLGAHEDEWRSWVLGQGIAWDVLHWRSLHDEPERAEDALIRLRAMV
jgi:5-methylcytosine-specific restriction endonuclease McrA